MPLGGLEPPTLAGYGPKPYAYSYSATEALLIVYSNLDRDIDLPCGRGLIGIDLIKKKPYFPRPVW